MIPLISSLEPLESRIAPAAIIVSNLSDNGPGSLRQAILNANASAATPDDITFQHKVRGHDVPLKGTIKLLTDLPAITDDLSITGPTAGKSNGIIINGNKHAIFNITGGDVAMTDLTVMHGQAQFGGGIFINDTGKTLTLTDVAITGNHAVVTTPGDTSYGGGVYIADGSTVTISKSKITGNFCTGIKGDATHGGGDAYGGGILCRGKLTITDSVISGNVAQGGSGLAGTGFGGGGAYGGGVYSSQTDGNVTIQHSTISGNESLGGNGGAGASAQNGGKGGHGNGGGVYTFDGATSISDSVISKNIAKGGKGGRAGTAAHGGAGGDSWGGGVSNKGGSASTTIQVSTISGNTDTAGSGGAGGRGGAKAGSPGFGRGGGVYSNNTLDISNSTISTNDSGDGGGIFIRGGNATILQSTIAKNNASHDGGGGTLAGGTIKIHNSTVALNHAGAGKDHFGGGFDITNQFVSNVEIISTIIAGNTANMDADVSAAGTISMSHTLIQQNFDLTNVTDNGNNIVNTNARLGSFGLHGGTTATILPSVNKRRPSLAIDHGSDPDNIFGDTNTDQRGTGFARVLPAAGGIIDIGAVEVA